VTVSLGGPERVILGLIEVRRQRRWEKRDSPSEIVADALRHYLTEVEEVKPDQIETLLPPISPKPPKLPKKKSDKKRDNLGT
jgi:hypothetical protein